MNLKLDNFADEINEVELSLARTILVQLEKKAITYDESREVAKSILSQIGRVKNVSELALALQMLCQKWSMFESIYQLYRLRAKDEQETQQKLEETKRKLAAINKN